MKQYETIMIIQLNKNERQEVKLKRDFVLRRELKKESIELYETICKNNENIVEQMREEK